MIDLIRERFRRMEYEYSLHAFEQSIQRRVSSGEVEEAIDAGEIIETYPSDRYGPRCLIFGRTPARRPLHVPAGPRSADRFPKEETADPTERWRSIPRWTAPGSSNTNLHRTPK